MPTLTKKNIEFNLPILSNEENRCFVATKLEELIKAAVSIKEKIEVGEITFNEDWERLNLPMNQILDILYKELAFRVTTEH